MNQKFQKLLEQARKYRETHAFSPEERERQIRSFAFGNTHLENPAITKSDIEKAAESLTEEREGNLVYS